MDIKSSRGNDSDEVSQEKDNSALQLEGNDHKISKAQQIHQIEAAVTDPNVTLESFAHLDIKKIHRKMDLRLIPMLALLYLLSFLGTYGKGEFRFA